MSTALPRLVDEHGRPKVPQRFRMPNPETAVDVVELLAAIGDYLFDVAEHFTLIGRDDDARFSRNIGIDLHLRGRYYAITGKKIHSLAQPDAMAQKLISSGAVDKGVYRHLLRIFDSNEAKSVAVVASTLRVSRRVGTDGEGVPRTREMARVLYRGAVLPPARMRSVVRKGAAQ